MTELSDHTVPAFGAFERLLKVLCINEFPCGLGTWREPDASIQKPKKLWLRSRKGKWQRRPVEQTVAKEPDPHKEKSEALQELVSSTLSPWHLDYTWSDEAKELREIAVKFPWLIDNKFVLGHFRTLKIIDKGVTEVDEKLLQLQNLNELTLSANYIRKVNSKHLPASLQMLELYANEISDISGLCAHPPLLLHLGLGFNSISFIGDYITGKHWPELLSLDLSNNNLTNLLGIICKISTLPKLRNLILLGNPLSLIPGYRGYTIDSLRKLSILDDIHISEDERHDFKGLARRKECILDEVTITLEVTYLKGIPMPHEMKFPEEQPEYPVIERTYYVCFMIPPDFPDQDTGLKDTTQDNSKTLGTIHGKEDSTSQLSAKETGSQHSGSHSMKSFTFKEQEQLKALDSLSPVTTGKSEELGKSTSKIESRASQDKGMKDDNIINTLVEKKAGIPTAPIHSVGKPWAEEIELNWKLEVSRQDLMMIRDFFKQGMDLSVIEQKVLCYPAEEEEATATPASSKKSKDGSKDKKDAKGKKGDAPAQKGAKDQKKKSETPAKKNAKEQSKGGKKKKKGSEVELRRESPQVTTLASFHMPLAELLDGEFDLTSVFTKDGVEIAPSTDHSLASADQKRLQGQKGKKGDKGNKNKKDKKDGGSDKMKRDTSTPGKGKEKKDGKSGKEDKKDGKGRTHSATEDENETPLPPPPLEVQVADVKAEESEQHH